MMTGCNGCGFGNKPIPVFYDIKEMLSIALNMESRNTFTQYDITKKMPYDNLLIGLQVSKRDFYAFNESVNTNKGNSNLMACSPAEPGSSGSKEIIKNIKIKSNNAFSADFPAGADLSKKFNLYDYSYSYNGIENIEALPNLAMIKPTDKFDYYLSYGTITPLEIINNPTITSINKKASGVCALKLNDAPTLSKSHIFTIEYEHIDGEKFTFVTQNINFL